MIKFCLYTVNIMLMLCLSTPDTIREKHFRFGKISIFSVCGGTASIEQVIGNPYRGGNPVGFV